MKYLVWGLTFVLGFSSFAGEESRDTLYHLSTITDLMAGDYRGRIPAGQLAGKGDFGIGTLEGLDGEMVVLDGQMMQIPFTGTVQNVESDRLVPFTALTFFDADQTVSLSQIESYDQLKQQLNGLRSQTNISYAIRISGLFDYIKCRSVPKQTPPYPPLLEVLKGQSVFEGQQVRGTMVGFYIPEYLAGVHAAGYHFHFVSDDHSLGGHVLECKPADVEAQLDDTEYLFLRIMKL